MNFGVKKEGGKSIDIVVLMSNRQQSKIYFIPLLYSYISLSHFRAFCQNQSYVILAIKVTVIVKMAKHL